MHEDEPTSNELAETRALLEILRLADEDIAAGRTIPAERYSQSFDEDCRIKLLVRVGAAHRPGELAAHSHSSLR